MKWNESIRVNPGKSILILVLFFLTDYHLSARDTLLIDREITKVDLLDYATLLKDPSGTIGIDSVVFLVSKFDEEYDIEQEFHYPESFWLRIPVRSSISLDGRIVIPGDAENDHVKEVIDYMDVYLADEAGRIVQFGKSGFYTPLSQKAIKSNALICAVPVTFKPDDAYNIYIRLQNARYPLKIRLNLELRDKNFGLPKLEFNERWLILGPWGMFLIIGLYVLVFYYFLRDRSFLYFGIFCLLYSHNLLSLEPDGGFINFIPEHPEIRSVLFSLSLYSLVFLFLFGNKFINVLNHFPSWYRYYQFIIFLTFGIVTYYTISSIWKPHVTYHTALFTVFICLIPVCIRFFLSKHVPARMFAIGIFAFLGGNLIGLISLMLGQNWGPFAWIIGQVILLFLFAIGLGYRMLESQKRKAEIEKVKELDEMKSRFFTNISHEFRTPLSLILSPLNNALESVPAIESDDQDQDIPVKVRHLNVMRRNALGLNKLINQILDLSKLESGKMKLNIVRGDILEFSKLRVAEFQDVADQKNIHFLSKYFQGNQDAFFDPEKLEMVLNNVMANAIQYTPGGGHITVEAKASSTYFHFSVANSCAGLSVEEINQMFDRFYQAENAAQQGSGIGLALVKELVELHHGNVSIESQVNNEIIVSIQLGIHPSLLCRI